MAVVDDLLHALSTKEITVACFHPAQHHTYICRQTQSFHFVLLWLVMMMHRYIHFGPYMRLYIFVWLIFMHYFISFLSSVCLLILFIFLQTLFLFFFLWHTFAWFLPPSSWIVAPFDIAGGDCSVNCKNLFTYEALRKGRRRERKCNKMHFHNKTWNILVIAFANKCKKFLQTKAHTYVDNRPTFYHIQTQRHIHQNGENGLFYSHRITFALSWIVTMWSLANW